MCSSCSSRLTTGKACASCLFQGVYFNLSLWYKLIDKTKFGAYFSLLGVVITIALNVALVPFIGYFGSAWASFACYFIIMLVSYFIGQKHFPVDYKLKQLAFYTVIALGMFIVSSVAKYVIELNTIAYYALCSVMLVGFLAIILKRDLPLKSIPVVNRFVKK